MVGSCGTFVHSGNEAGRPVYERDAGLSAWNSKMKYWGPGYRSLHYEENLRKGNRWVFSDGQGDRRWAGYEDQSYAYLVSDAEHPGELEGETWTVFQDAQSKERRCWKPDKR